MGHPEEVPELPAGSYMGLGRNTVQDREGVWALGMDLDEPAVGDHHSRTRHTGTVQAVEEEWPHHQGNNSGDPARPGKEGHNRLARRVAVVQPHLVAVHMVAGGTPDHLVRADPVVPGPARHGGDGDGDVVTSCSAGKKE